MMKSYFDDNFVQLPRGSFLMGSDDVLAKEREKPVHEVQINYDIAMSKRQVTVEEYMLFAQATGAEVPDERHEQLGFDVPVRRVRYHDAKAYCAWQTQREGITYRLPTEAEWEYACRAGSTGKYCFGDDEGEFGEYAWYAENSEGVTHDVGTKKPNAWGLYDMHGNVWEWCADWYDMHYYRESPRQNPKGPNNKAWSRVVRGGSWGNPQVGVRHSAGPLFRHGRLGFRCATSIGN